MTSYIARSPRQRHLAKVHDVHVSNLSAEGTGAVYLYIVISMLAVFDILHACVTARLIGAALKMYDRTWTAMMSHS